VLSPAVWCAHSDGAAEWFDRSLRAAFGIEGWFRARVGQCGEPSRHSPLGKTDGSLLVLAIYLSVSVSFSDGSVCVQECTHLGTLTGHSSSVNSVVGHSAGRLTLTASSGMRSTGLTHLKVLHTPHVQTYRWGRGLCQAGVTCSLSCVKILRELTARVCVLFACVLSRR
jgi:hypothetical protein